MWSVGMLIVWVASAVVATKIGAKKGEKWGAMIIGILLGPVGILVALASSGRRNPNPARKAPVWAVVIVLVLFFTWPLIAWRLVGGPGVPRVEQAAAVPGGGAPVMAAKKASVRVAPTPETP